MIKKLVIEGDLKEDGGELFLHTKPPKGNTLFGSTPDALMEKFVGKRIRVTIEEIEEEDCPPATGADGRRPAGKGDW